MQEEEDEAGYGDETMRAISEALRSVNPGRQTPDPDWYPRELTGLGEDEDDAL